MKYLRFLEQLFNKGTKKYKCKDCLKINHIKPDDKKITIGYCWNCEHPIWG